MIITQTPFRMSFFGGGTDIPSYFQEHGGAVLSTTFDKYCYVNVRHLPRFFDYTTELSYSQIERVSDIDDIDHPAIKNAMKMLNMHEIRLTYEGDLPSRTGLGTSSSFAVGMLQAFHSLKGSYVSPERLAKEAIHLERDLCKEAGGWQDQIAAAYGGLNRINFYDNDFEVSPIIIRPERKRLLEGSLLLFFTGFSRSSAEIQKTTRYEDHTSALKDMVALVDQAEAILIDKHADLAEFGNLLDQAWNIKRSLGSLITTDHIDDLYKKALNAGALGGKLLGAGGGGFLLFFVEKDAQQSVRAALSDLMEIPFSFEEGGSRVIHYSPEDYVFPGMGKKRDVVATEDTHEASFSNEVNAREKIINSKSGIKAPYTEQARSFDGVYKDLSSDRAKNDAINLPQMDQTDKHALDELIARYPALEVCRKGINKAAYSMYCCLGAGHKILICGNGGSAADAEHIVGELMKSFTVHRNIDESFIEAYRKSNDDDPPTYLEGSLPAISLVSQSALTTAFANDRASEGIFAQQIYGYGNEGDVLIAISTSGNSVNVVEAAKVAKAKGMGIVALTGQKHSQLSAIATTVIQAPAVETYKIQEYHLPIYHALCSYVEQNLFA